MLLRLWIALACLLAPLPAADFDAAELFGNEHYSAQAGTPGAGTIRLALTGPLPSFVDLHSSGDGDFSDRFAPAATGLLIRADDKLHRSCEAAIDIGADKLEAEFMLVELELGATVAWHLAALDRQTALDYLCEVRRNQGGGYQFQIRAGDGVNFRALPGASAVLEKVELPCRFRVELSAGALAFTVGGQSLSAQPKAAGGLRPAIAVSDGAARVRDLVLRADFARLWVEDAGQRMAARRALLRLRELALGGLLGGIWAHECPANDAQQAEWQRELAKAPEGILNAPAGRRAAALYDLALVLKDNPRAQHMAGVAALLAGDVDAGLACLEAAQRLNPSSITRLALAEAQRRAGRLTAAEATLKAARTGMPAALEPEYQLLAGRLAAARGDLPQALASLQAAAKAHPDHAVLQDFASSAASLANPAGLRLSTRPGPLGLRVMSDLPDLQLGSMLARLEPYLDRFRVWLPKLPRKLEGTVLVYAGPVDYLNAALLVAGDNLDNVAGMFLPAGFEAKPTVLACRGFGEDELLRTLVHELWHVAFAAAGLAKDAPRWLNEGMAVYFSAGRVSSSVLVFDRIPAEFNPALPALDAAVLARAVSAQAVDFYLPGDIRANYAAAWAIVWHLMSGDEGAGTLRKLLANDADAHAQLKKDLESIAPKLEQRVAKLHKGG